MLTTLNRQANPLLRYRTRDLTTLLDEACSCGRSHRRLRRIAGRTDDMFIVRGCNVYPMQIERVLMDTDEIGANYVVRLTTEGDLDQMAIAVELKAGAFPDDLRQLDAMRKRVVEAIRHETMVTPRVELLQPNSLPASEGKAVRVVDERER